MTAFVTPLIAGFFLSRQHFSVLDNNPNFGSFIDAVEGGTIIYGGMKMLKLAKLYDYGHQEKNSMRSEVRENQLEALTQEARKSNEPLSKAVVAYLGNNNKKKEQSLFRHCIDLMSQTGREGLELMIFIAAASVARLDASYLYNAELTTSLLASTGLGLAVPTAIWAGPVIVKKIIRCIKGSESEVAESECCECGWIQKTLYKYNAIKVFFTLFAGALLSYGAHELAEAWNWDVTAWDLVGTNVTSVLDEKQPVGGLISAVVPYDTDPSIEQAALIIGFWAYAFGIFMQSLYENLTRPGDEPCYLCGKRRGPHGAAVGI